MSTTIRRLRVNTASRTHGAADIRQTQSIDAIEDPHRLAYALIEISPEVEQRSYMPYLRCSSLHDVCVREQLLGWRSGKKFTKRTHAGLQVTFDIGNGLHQHFQNKDEYFRNRRLGWWECLACGNVVFGRKAVQPCRKCGANSRAIAYKEHHMQIREPWRLSGHPDDLLEVDSGDIRILELKSISGGEFESLTRPLGSHVIQVNGYLLGMEYDRSLPVRVNTEKALIVYVSKRHVEGEYPWKAFHVHRDDMALNSIREDLEQFTRGYGDSSYLPEPLVLCKTARFGAGRAKWCPMKEECQSLA